MHETALHVMVTTTLGTRDDALAFARALVDRRLVACAQVSASVTAVYRWKGAVEEANEALLTLKTRRDRLRELAQAFGELHPYEVPEFVVTDLVAGSAAYLAFIDDGTVDH